MENCCLNCKHFRVWDDDPCCLEQDGWKIVLPSMFCNKHNEETFKPVLQLHREMWEACKEDFFKRYSIDKQELIEKHLKLFPEDDILINQENG